MILSSADFPTQNWYDIQKYNKNFLNKHFINATMSLESLKKKIIAVKIFYPHLKFTSIVELKKINFLDLLSGIGGTLGLFCGLSILHLIKFAKKFIFKYRCMFLVNEI